ncbi:MAG: hypothetical protein HPY67_10785 [Syntrophaceae bacterium]|nr:hypothetical protein [Syntrophaceae bacterium]
MSDIPLSAWGWMLAAMLASSGAGLALARLVPWSDAARQAGIPRAFAFAIAPFLLGMLAVIALGVFRGASHAFHLGVVFTGQLLLCSTVTFSRPLPKIERPGTPTPIGRWEWVFAGLLTVWIVALMANTAFLPLIQNDSLEYATVGRLLFETRDLLSYPAIQPELSNSGFYGPWTHPPLYAALIYLFYVFQGQAELPGLIRWIAPWFALAATGVVFALGNLSSRLLGILSALVFISVPLFFLGAGSALIDPLPVLGLTLLYASIVGIDGSPFQRGLIQGLALGISLWTHSQAVLFIPLGIVAAALFRGWSNWTSLMRQLGTMIVVALPLAAWPYVRNLLLYGSLISDTPLVFSMKELAWDEYFRMSRGIDSWLERVQYGVFKGWFAFEAYSISFWLMAWGGVLYVRRFFVEAKGHAVLRGDVTSVPERWQFAAMGIVLCYLGGVILSILMGIDLMIRNERYWLVLVPFVAIFAGAGVAQSISASGGKTAPARKSLFSRLITPFIALCFVLQAAATILLYNWAPYLKFKSYLPIDARDFELPGKFMDNRLAIDAEDFELLGKFMDNGGISSVLRRVNRHEIVVGGHSSATGRPYDHRATIRITHSNEGSDKLLLWPHIQVMKYLRDRVLPSSTVLSFRPADMYYSERRMISCYDPRLLPFYREHNAFEAWTYLKKLGVDYLHIPDYYNPTIYNSVVQEILSRHDLSTLVFSADGTQIYKLTQTSNKADGVMFDLTPGRFPWTKVVTLTGGRKALGRFSEITPTVAMTNKPLPDTGLPLFQRDWSTIWTSGIGAWNQSIATEVNVPVLGAREYRLEMDLEGHALVRVWLMQMDGKGTVLRGEYPLSAAQMRIGELILGPTYPERRFTRRFVTHPEAAYIRVGVEHVGSSRMRIVEAKLTPIIEKKHSSRR